MQSSPPTTPDLTSTCLECGREFSTSEVRIYRFRFPADRFCEFCREAERVRQEQLRADILFEQAMIPAEYRECEFKNFEPREGTGHAYAIARRWTEDFRHGVRQRRGLVFHGPPGSGKTHLAVAVMREAIYSNRLAKCLFLNVPEWLNALREVWNSNDNSAAQPPNPSGYQIVVVDDLGAENSTDWTRERIYSLLNHREQAGLLTLATTNLDPGELGRRLGRATASRLGRLCAEVPIDPRSDFRVESQ